MADLIGQRLGQYEIVALLGEGGMATVYRARQVSIGRDVAVKVIESKLARNPEFVRRFEREARTVAQLSQIHILKVFDYGQQDDLIYLAMELLAGGSLEARIRQGGLSVDRVSRFLDQVSSALDYAHERGVIHRDLKPSNVLLDERGDAHLTDFGIAKMLGETTMLTQSGLSIGTPAYMSPEQWLGQPIDSRADIYALGVMLFQMLSGELPFGADTPFGMMHMHVYDPPPPVRELRPDVPPGVDRVLQQALSKEREKRFQTAEEMAQAFKSALAGKTVPVQRTQAQPAPDSPTPTLKSTLSRFRTRSLGRTNLLSLGAAITVLIVFVSVILGLSNRRPSPDAAAQAPTNTPQGVLMLPVVMPSATVASTVTPADTLPPSHIPSIQRTPDVRATAVVAVRETATANARASLTHVSSPTLDIGALVLATIHAEATLTATHPSATPTIDLPATLSAAKVTVIALTQAVEETATAIAVASFTYTPSLTASNTATHTLTPTSTWTLTLTYSRTPTATRTFMPTASLSPTPIPTMTPIATDTQTATTTPTASLSATPDGETITPALTSTLEAMAIVKKDDTNLRRGPDVAFSVIDTVNKGDQLPIIAKTADDSNLWYLVELPNGKPAWIWSAMVDVNLSQGKVQTAATIPVTLTPTLTMTPNMCYTVQPGLPCNCNGVCDPGGESYYTCPQDCPYPPIVSDPDTPVPTKSVCRKKAETCTKNSDCCSKVCQKSGTKSTCK